MPVYAQNILAWTPGTTEWIVILIVALLLFGRRLPELARGLGKSLTEFKKGLNEVSDTKNEIASDIRKTKDDVVNQAKDASGFNDINKP
jgi:sec-independent protein translocase protein TatA